MGSLRKTWKKTDPSQLLIRKTLGDKTYDKMSPLGAEQEQKYDYAKAAQKAAETAIPMPDEEDLQRAKRRSTSRQMNRTGRQSTILTSSDRLGP